MAAKKTPPAPAAAEIHNRFLKAFKLLVVLDEAWCDKKGHVIGPAGVKELTAAGWAYAATVAGVKAPSDATKGVVGELVAARAQVVKQFGR